MKISESQRKDIQKERKEINLTKKERGWLTKWLKKYRSEGGFSSMLALYDMAMFEIEHHLLTMPGNQETIEKAERASHRICRYLDLRSMIRWLNHQKYRWMKHDYHVFHWEVYQDWKKLQKEEKNDRTKTQTKDYDEGALSYSTRENRQDV